MYGTWHSYSIYLNSYSLYQYLYRYRYIPKIRTVYTYTYTGIGTSGNCTYTYSLYLYLGSPAKVRWPHRADAFPLHPLLTLGCCYTHYTLSRPHLTLDCVCGRLPVLTGKTSRFCPFSFSLFIEQFPLSNRQVIPDDAVTHEVRGCAQLPPCRPWRRCRVSW